MKLTMLAVGVMLAADRDVPAARGGGAGRRRRPAESRCSWLEPYVGSGAGVAAGIGLVTAAVLIGIGLGRWGHPKPVPTSTERRNEGLQG